MNPELLCIEHFKAFEGFTLGIMGYPPKQYAQICINRNKT